MPPRACKTREWRNQHRSTACMRRGAIGATAQEKIPRHLFYGKRTSERILYNPVVPSNCWHYRSFSFNVVLQWRKVGKQRPSSAHKQTQPFPVLCRRHFSSRRHKLSPTQRENCPSLSLSLSTVSFSQPGKHRLQPSTNPPAFPCWPQKKS